MKLYSSVSFCCLYLCDLELTTEDVIKQHRAEILYEDDFNAHRITVRRGNIMDDTIASLRVGFDEKKHVRVRFIGEPAVDEGGPRREFFMLPWVPLLTTVPF